MNFNVQFRDEIALSVGRVANEEKIVAWNDILDDLKDIIAQNYQGGNSRSYKGDWKRRIKVVVKSMGYKLAQFDKDMFVPLEKPSSSSTTSSSPTSNTSGSNYILSAAEKERVVNNYNNVKREDRWVLSTGTVVDEKMKELAEQSKYEHPVHSFILDPTDLIWEKFFTRAEIDEIVSFKIKQFPSLEEDVEECIESYSKNWKSAEELYEFADNKHHHPVKDFDSNWVKESVLKICELFIFDQALSLNEYSEADLLHKMWCFTYQAFKDRKVKALLGEKSSVSVSLGRNEERSLEAVNKRPRKSVGAKLDILFKCDENEFGACEVGKSDVAVVDDKYLDDGLFKLPKTLRDMLSVLVNKNPAQLNNLYSVGYLIMGLNLELVVMDVPCGNLICRVNKTCKLNFPTSIETVVVDFFPLLEVTLKGKEMMMKLNKILKNRKRKTTDLGESSANNKQLLPFAFVRNSSSPSS